MLTIKKIVNHKWNVNNSKRVTSKLSYLLRKIMEDSYVLKPSDSHIINKSIEQLNLLDRILLAEFCYLDIMLDKSIELYCTKIQFIMDLAYYIDTKIVELYAKHNPEDSNICNIIYVYNTYEDVISDFTARYETLKNKSTFNYSSLHNYINGGELKSIYIDSYIL